MIKTSRIRTYSEPPTPTTIPSVTLASALKRHLTLSLGGRTSSNKSHSQPIPVPFSSRPRSDSCSASSFSESSSTSPSSSLATTPTRYVEIPMLVKPLSPSRPVLKVEDMEALFSQEGDMKDVMLMEKIRSAQTNLRLTDSSSPLNCDFIIGIHATPTTFAGYCVNLTRQTSPSCEIYTYDVADENFPWDVPDRDQEGVTIHNLMFALLLWENDIRGKKVLLYIGNEEDEEDESKMIELLHHYSSCEKVTWMNENDMHLHRKRVENDDTAAQKKSFHPDLDYFGHPELYGLTPSEFKRLVQFIQPAMDLACGNKGKLAEGYLRNLYGLDDVKKTHWHKKWNKAENRYWVEITETYDEFLEKVRTTLSQKQKSSCSRKCTHAWTTTNTSSKSTKSHS